MKKVKLTFCAIFVVGLSFGQELPELYAEYTNLQASLIQLNFANTDLSTVSTNQELLTAYASYLQNAIQQGDVPLGTPKIGGDDPIEGIDIIVMKDPSSKPMDNPGNIPIIDEVNKLEAEYLTVRVNQLKQQFNKTAGSKLKEPQRTEAEKKFVKAEIEFNKAEKADVMNRSSEAKYQQALADGFGPPYRGSIAAGEDDGFGPPYRGVVAADAVDGFGPPFRGSVYVGSSSPVGKFKDFAKTGIDFGLTFDYGFNKNWGIGIDINNQQNGVNFPSERYKIPADGQYPIDSTRNYTISSTKSSKGWSTTTLGIGPWWKIQPGGSAAPWSYEVYAKAGVSWVSSPSAKTTLDYINNQSGDLYAMDAQKKTAFGLTSGFRINYQFSEGWAVFLNPQYVYTAAKIEYSYKDLTNAYKGDDFNPGAAIESPTKNDFVTPNYFNVNFGVTYNFGALKSKAAPADGFGPVYRGVNRKEEPEGDKRRIVLVKTENRSQFKNSSEIETFTWSVQGDPYVEPNYEIELKQIGKNAKTYKTNSPTNSVAASQLFKESLSAGNYVWHVKELNSGDQSGNFNLKIGNSGLNLTLQNIACQSPAFDENGNVLYTGEVYFENNSSTDIIVENSTWLMYGSGPTTDAEIIGCGTPPNVLFPQTLPFTITPGNTVTACISFERPFGETVTTIGVDYHNQNLRTTQEYIDDSLPNCICNTCESWRFMTKEQKVTPVNSAAGNININQTLQINGADPIQQVKAEIVFVKHLSNDPECYTCTKEDDHMAMFTNQNNSGLITTGSTNWQNNGFGELLDENSDTYGNQFTWNVADQSGVDFNTPQEFDMTLNLPAASQLECCRNVYQICIRYTFTDINCITCSEVVCYTFEP